MDPDSVKAFIRREVPDWDDDVMATARFKAFSGQRSDWESKFIFWKDLILKISREFSVFIIDPLEVKNLWFNRGGLTPLCVEHVLSVMHDDGDIMRIEDLDDPATGRLSWLLKKVKNLIGRSTLTPDNILEKKLIILPLLKEKAAEVMKVLSEDHWTSSCIVTMKKFQNACGGLDESSAVLSYLSSCEKAQYLSVNKKEFMEGVKVSLSQTRDLSISSLDFDILHLLWTTEKLQEQLDVIDRRYEMSKASALASLKSRNKKMALRYARELKLANESREKCMSLLSRVEEVLNVISDSESTKKVSEAIKIGAQAMKENKISVEEVHDCLEELEETIEYQKQVENALESAVDPAIDDEEIEEEFMKLEMELENSTSLDTPEASESAEQLTDAFLNLKLADDSGHEAVQETSQPVKTQDSPKPVLEAA